MIHPHHVCSSATTLATRRTSTSTTARRASLLALAVGLAVSAGAQAVNTSRTGDGDWYDATRWSSGVPTATNSWAYVDGYTLSLQTPGAQSWPCGGVAMRILKRSVRSQPWLLASE